MIGTQKHNMGVVAVIIMIVLLMPTTMSWGGFQKSDSDICIIAHSQWGNGLTLMAMGYNIVERYESFTLARLTPEERANIERSGWLVNDMSTRTRIMVSDYVFDAYSEPSIPYSLRIDAYPVGVTGLYIIQLIGPVKGTWLAQLETLDVQIISFIPDNSYLVLMRPEARLDSENLYFIENVLIYQPAYKILCNTDCGTVLVTMIDSQEVGTPMDVLSCFGRITGIYKSGELGIFQIRLELKSPDEVIEIARIPTVISIENSIVSDMKQQHSETEAEISGGNWTAGTPYGGAGSYVNLLGWDGSDVQVSICDGGVGNGASGHPDFQDRYKGGIDYRNANRNLDGSLATCSSDGLCSHGTHMAGIVGGDTYRGTMQTYHTGYYVGNGVAPNCTLASQRLFSEVGDYFFNGVDTQANWEMFFGDSYFLGTEICACSFGLTSGTYSARSSYFDHAVRDCNVSVSGDQPLSITESVGNSGPSSKVTEPGTAKNILAVGGTETYYPDANTYSNGNAANSDNPDQLYTGSNAGTNDNRIKPDVVAPAQDTLSTGSQFDSSTYYEGRAYKNGTVDFRYYWNAGTSFSSPNGAGSLAVIYQWFKARYGVYPSPAMAKALIQISAKDISGSGSSTDIPNYREGWGRIYLPDAITPPVDVLKRDQVANLQTGETYFVNFTCQNTAQPLKIMMAYTDYQAAGGAAKAMVNNLDLKVTAPNSDIYYGNSFTNGCTVANGYAGNTNFGYDWDDDNNHYDDHNNVEAVYIQTPTAGTYRIEVIAANIVSDAVAATGDVDQNFALLAYNVLNGDLDVAPPSFAGVKSAVVTTGSVGSVRVAWDVAQDWSTPITYSLWRFDHSPSESEINSTAAIWDGAALAFTDTGLDTSKTYWYIVRARDSFNNMEYNMVIVNCSAEKLYFFQAQFPGSGYRNLNLDPMESAPQTSATVTISSVGDYKIDVGNSWLSPIFPSATSLDGMWKFNAHGTINNRYTHGSLYAVVKRYSDLATLFTTTYDDEDVASFTTGYHLFQWQHTVSGVTLPAGDRYYVEMWLHVTVIPATPTTRTYDYSSGSHVAYYLDSDDTPPYIINNNPNPTYSQIAYSDDIRSLSRDPSLRNWISLRCDMYLTETSSQVDEVEMLWEGKGNPADSNNIAPVEDQGYLPFYVWNFATSKWLKVSQCSFNRSTDSILRYTFTNATPGFTQWSDYIGPGNEFRWLAHYKVMDLTMLTDYVNITVRYSQATDGVFTFAYDSDSTPSSVHDPALDAPPPTFNISVTTGWNLISYPLLASGAPQTVLNDAAGDGLTLWNMMQWYSIYDTADHWKSYASFRPASVNDLATINNTMGLWIYNIQIGDGYLTIQASQPTTTNIYLKAGWNLVGYPSNTPRVASTTLPASADIVGIFNATDPYRTTDKDPSDVTMQAGKGYWVHCTADTVWTVPW